MFAARGAQHGRYYLTDPWANRIVETAALRRGDFVLDIGAGTGVLTTRLVHAGARVLAVEIDPQRCAELRLRFQRTSVKVVRADAAHLRLPRFPFYVVSNPPFSITTLVLNRLTAPGSQLVAAHLVLQTAAARRWADGGATIFNPRARNYDWQVAWQVPRKAFNPIPRVDAALLVIRRRV